VEVAPGIHGTWPLLESRRGSDTGPRYARRLLLNVNLRERFDWPIVSADYHSIKLRIRRRTNPVQATARQIDDLAGAVIPGCSGCAGRLQRDDLAANDPSIKSITWRASGNASSIPASSNTSRIHMRAYCKARSGCRTDEPKGRANARPMSARWFLSRRARKAPAGKTPSTCYLSFFQLFACIAIERSSSLRLHRGGAFILDSFQKR
jgi:hypothetical protein